MTLRTRLRRALCRHDWLPTYRQVRSNTLGSWTVTDAKCRKCGTLRRAEA